MKKLLNIILFALLSLACRCQEPDTLIYYTQDEVDSILELKNSQILDLVDHNAELLTIIDSLEGSQPSGVFIVEYDTAYVYIEDYQGNTVEVRKNGAQINTKIVKGLERISTFWTDERQVFLMDNEQTKASILEDSVKYDVNLIDVDLTIRKRK